MSNKYFFNIFIFQLLQATNFARNIDTHSVLRSFLPSFLLSLFPSFPLSFFPSSTIALFLRSSFPSIPSSSCHSFPTSCPHNLFDRSLHHALIFLPPLPSSVSIPYPAKCPSIVHERFKTASSENKQIINRQASKPQSLRVPRRDSRSDMRVCQFLLPWS